MGQFQKSLAAMLAVYTEISKPAWDGKEASLEERTLRAVVKVFVLGY